MKKLIFLFPILLLMVSCMTQKKQQKIAHSYMSMNPDELAKICSSNFTSQVSNYIKGETIYKTRTVTDSIPFPVYVDCPDGTVQKADCPPNKTVYVDESRVDTIEVMSTEAKAYIKVLEKESLDLANKLHESEGEKKAIAIQRDEYKKEARNRMFMLIAAGALFVIGIILKFKKILF